MVTRATAKKTVPRKRRAAAAPTTKMPPDHLVEKPVATAPHTIQENVTHAMAGALGLNGERMSKVDTAWLRQSPQFFETTQTGEVLSRLTTDKIGRAHV